MDAQTELKRIAHELRAYNPAADEYKGKHIHGVWAREIDAVLVALSDAAQAPVEMSPEFTDSARAALVWVLYHHQGGSSPVGQPIRFALGMGAHDPLTPSQIGEALKLAEASRWPYARELPRAATVVADAAAPTHHDDECVDRFAEAMKAKLARAREKGRSGWEQCAPADLSRMLREHVEKGDPRDVANFCMFLWSLEAPISKVAQPDERAAFRNIPLYDDMLQALEHVECVYRLNVVKDDEPSSTLANLQRVIARARATAPQATMPLLTDAMRAVLRNENCIYGSEDDLYTALCAAADVEQRTNDDAISFIKDISTQKPEKPDYWSACGQCEHNIERAQEILESQGGT